MGALLDATKAFLKGEKWEFDEAKDRPILRMLFKGQHGRWVVYAHAREQLHQVVFYSVLAEEAAKERRAAVAELCTRVNFNLSVGNFEMDLADGNIRFRTSVDFENGTPQANVIRNLALANVVTMDKYREVFLDVLKGTAPEKALAALKD